MFGCQVTSLEFTSNHDYIKLFHDDQCQLESELSYSPFIDAFIVRIHPPIIVIEPLVTFTKDFKPLLNLDEFRIDPLRLTEGARNLMYLFN